MLQACSDASENVFLSDNVHFVSATSAAIIIKTNADVDVGCALLGEMGARGLLGGVGEVTLGTQCLLCWTGGT